MAIDPSATSENASRSKQRRSVIPALPLLPSDRKWKRQSVSTVSQNAEPNTSADSIADSTAEVIGATIQQAETTSTPTSVDPQQLSSQEQDTTHNIEHAERISEIHTTGKDEYTDLPSQDAHVESESHTPNSTSADNQAEPALQSQNTEAQEASVDLDATLLNVSQSSLEQVGISSTASVSQDVPDIEEDLSRVETIVDTSARQVRLPEDDAQNSEIEVSSMHNSSNTGPTDYSPTPVDSSLEAVSGEQQPDRRIITLSHRKSEAAPEVLTNGHSTNQSTESKSSHTDGFMPSHNAPMLPIHAHLLRLSYSKQNYDIVIQLSPSDPSRQQPTFHCAHTVFLIRSQRLAELIPIHESSAQPRPITINPVRVINGHAFEAALRYFYTDEVLTTDALIPKGGFPQKDYKVQNFNYAISYWFAGLELGIENIKTRALDILKALVDWELAEVVMREAQDLRMAADSLNSVDSFEIYGVAETLASIVIRLLVERINIHNFRIDPEAQVTTMLTRFAQLETHRTFSNPALSTMVFGSLPAPMTAPASFELQASGILLNMSFSELGTTALALALEYSTDSLSVLQQVVNEREAKRESVVSNRTIPNHERVSNSSAWEVASWREFIREGRLEHERVGFLLPPRNSRQILDA